MKKDVYIITGIVALILVGFIFAYNRYSKPAVVSEETTSSSTTQLKVNVQTLLGSADHSMGPTMAKVVVVEFLDPECEACRAFHPRVKKILAEFEGKVRFVTRYMPFHHNSPVAIRALHAANLQGKLWPYMDLILNKQTEWGESRDDKTPMLFEYAKSMGMDMKKFKEDFDSEAAKERVRKDESDGKAVGVSGTPSFYINGSPLLDLGEEPLRSAIVSAFNE